MHEHYDVSIFVERFEDIGGVTLYEDRPVEHILCWVSDSSKNYIDTKPIHGSYTSIKGALEQQLRLKYPQLKSGMFFTLDCIPNFELHSLLYSYGQKLVVLSPDSIRADMQEEAQKQASRVCGARDACARGACAIQLRLPSFHFN